MLDLLDTLNTSIPAAVEGTVVRVDGICVGIADFPVPVGALVEIATGNDSPLRAEVIGFDRNLTLVYPLDHLQGARQGDRARLVRTKNWLRVGEGLLGRVIDAHGQCIDGGPRPMLADRVPLERPAMRATDRLPIDTALSTGLRAIDGLVTCGRGQRLGIFAGSGVGKSVALGMMARYTSADVNVIALVGERGREVGEFIATNLGPEGLARSIVVVATSDEPAPLRRRAALVATAIAEYFRDRGGDVLLMMDSLTRFALAQREIAMAAGEPAVTRGFPPSVFAWLARLVERAGRTSTGSITALYSVLVEGDDPHDPLADAVRGLLDGHAWLSRKLAARNQYPAFDILDSLSRSMPGIADAEHRAAAARFRELLAIYREHEDLITLGVYRRGNDPRIDLAIDTIEPMLAFLRQGMEERSSVEEARGQLVAIGRQVSNVHI